jgi:hypothetical protein
MSKRGRRVSISTKIPRNRSLGTATAVKSLCDLPLARPTGLSRGIFYRRQDVVEDGSRETLLEPPRRSLNEMGLRGWPEEGAVKIEGRSYRPFI